MSAIMTIVADGTLLCHCGNTPDSDGFDPCNVAGVIDYALLNADSDADLHYICNRCDNISQNC